jgi:Transposase
MPRARHPRIMKNGVVWSADVEASRHPELSPGRAHQAQLIACVRTIVQGEVLALIETFETTTPDLLALRDWLLELGVTHVAMESTGVDWKAPCYVLRDSFEMLLVNAAQIKHVPGRKTDTIDAQWIAQLLAHGLLRSSFVPPNPIRRLRGLLTRYRKALIKVRTRTVNRLQKVLEDAGVKLACVANDAMGVSGRAMMRALIEGQADPDALAELAKGKLPAPRKALQGRFEDHPSRVPCWSGSSPTSRSSKPTSRPSLSGSRRRRSALSSGHWSCLTRSPALTAVPAR